MQLTLLQIVQRMLTAIEAEAVDDVADTEEAAMCVTLANMAYEELIYRLDWDHLKSVTALTAATYKNELDGPSNTIEIDVDNVYYNGNRMTFVEPATFLSRLAGRDATASDVETVNNWVIVNDRDPTFFTSYDGTTLIFEAIPSTSGLTTSLSRAMIKIGPSAVISGNSSIFNLPARAFPALVNFCLAKAYQDLKGDTQAAMKAEAQGEKILRHLIRTSNVVRTKSRSYKDHATARP